MGYTDPYSIIRSSLSQNCSILLRVHGESFVLHPYTLGYFRGDSRVVGFLTGVESDQYSEHQPIASYLDVHDIDQAVTHDAPRYMPDVLHATSLDLVTKMSLDKVHIDTRWHIRERRNRGQKPLSMYEVGETATIRGSFARWEDVEEWTGHEGGWRGRRLVFAGNWVLHMTVEAGYHWAHSHPQSQVVWLTSGELLAKIGDPGKPEEIKEQVLRPGDLLLIPSDVHHDMTALTDLEAWETRGMEGPDGWEEFSVRITPDGD